MAKRISKHSNNNFLLSSPDKEEFFTFFLNSFGFDLWFILINYEECFFFDFALFPIKKSSTLINSQHIVTNHGGRQLL